jgi:DNA invertase Pin-like site-specific DNA recombinase
MKALVMTRVSTETQKLEDQHREMEVFCHDEGYDELVFVEDKGASAIKLNDQYRLMISQVKEEIEKDPAITCFAVWELSRAFRNEGVYYEVKTFLLERGIQFICKNPYLKLLNTDGSLNQGMEIAMSLFATLAKQEMELKKERFKRAKKAMVNQGRFIGGRGPRFGYRVGKDGYIEIDPETGPIVRMIFEMYSTGKWSVRGLWEELVSRGYDVSYHIMGRMLWDRSYIDSPYPPIISQELWDRCEEVRKRHYISIPQGNRHCFGAGIFKCPECGNNMIPEGAQYRCRHHNKVSAPPHCPNGLTIRVENLDGLLWFMAVQEETKYRMRMFREGKDEVEKEVDVLREKIDAARKKLEGMDEKKGRIMELYLEGHLKKEEKDRKLLQCDENSKKTKNTILELEEKLEGFLTILEGKADELPDLEKLKGIYEGVVGESDLKEMDRIVKRQIRKVTAVRAEFKGRKSAQLIEVETMYSGVKRFYYVARAYKMHYFFLTDGTPLRTVRRIIREPLGEGNPRAFKKLSEW